MSLAIGRLATRASIPRSYGSVAPVIDRVAHGRLGRAFSDELSSMRAGGRAVCRIRRLRVRVRLPAKGLTEDLLIKLWAEAFGRSVRAAVNRTDRQVEVVIAESRARWLAAYLARRASGEIPTDWACGEFEAANSLPLGEVAVSLIEETPQDALEILDLMDRESAFDRLLFAMDDEQCARLCGVIDRSDPTTRGWAIGDLVLIARLLLDRAARRPDAKELATNARALAIVIEQAKSSAGHPLSRHAVSDVLAMLRVLDQLSAVRRVMDAAAYLEALAFLVPRLHDLTAETLRDAMARGGSSRSPRGYSGAVAVARVEPGAELVPLIDRLLVAVPSSGVSVARDLTGRWIDSAAAGVFLLVPVVQRLQWPERIMASHVWSEYGPRALTYTLAGIGLTIMRRAAALDDVERIDHGVAIFAGWIDEPYLTGFRRFLEATSPEMRNDLLRSLLEGADNVDNEEERAAESWETTFDRLATHLVRRFATRVRGFRQSSRPFIVRNFVNVPGHVAVEDDRVKVVLSRNPLWVAVHLSGADDPIEQVSWLGDRSLEFELEGF